MISAVLCLLSLAIRLTSALNPVLIKGNVFYDSVTNERVYLRGIDYQPLGAQGIDPLLDPEVCARDLFLMQQLGVNVMRVYTVDPTKNHDTCMSIYNAGGIYLMLDVNAAHEGRYLNRLAPWITYNERYATNVFTTMQVFSGYSNVIGYFCGNELINDDKSAYASPPYLKAMVRDMKAFTAAHLNRPSLIGYSAADDLRFRTETADYMSCGDVNTGKSDFYAINSYQFCGDSTFHDSGYDTLMEQFKDFTIPLFFSEVGCNVVKRTFKDVDLIFGSEMSSKLSGCMVYEFSQEVNNYGLVNIEASGDVSLLEDFAVLQNKYLNVQDLPKDLPDQASTSTECPAESSFKHINGSSSLPALQEIQKIIEDGVNAQPGQLFEIDLFATRYKIVDAAGVEITDKTPKRVSGLSNVDLKPVLSQPENVPTATPTFPAPRVPESSSTLSSSVTSDHVSSEESSTSTTSSSPTTSSLSTTTSSIETCQSESKTAEAPTTTTSTSTSTSDHESKSTRLSATMPISSTTTKVHKLVPTHAQKDSDVTHEKSQAARLLRSNHFNLVVLISFALLY